MNSRIIIALYFRLWWTCKRHWIYFGVILIYPIALSLFNVIYHLQTVQIIQKDRQLVLHEVMSKADVMELPSSLSMIAVCPDSEEVKQLMAAVVKYFSEENMSQEDEDEKPVQMVFKSDEEQLARYILNKSKGTDYFSKGFGIIFEKLSPSTLTYTLRSTKRDGWFTTTNFHRMASPQDRGVYFSEGFLPLQIAINQAYTKDFLKHNLSSWTIQGFPYLENRHVIRFSHGKSTANANLQLLLISAVICIFGALMIQEKLSGEKELLRLNGISTCILFGYWFFVMGLFGLFSAIVTTICWKYPFKNGPFLPNCDTCLLFIILVVYFWATVCLVGFASTITNSKTFGLTCIGLIVIIIPSTCLILTQFYSSSVLLFVLALLPGFNIAKIINALQIYEELGYHVGFDRLFDESLLPINALPIGFCLLIMTASMFIFVILMLYFDAIMPGPYGRAKPFPLVFSRSHCCREKNNDMELPKGSKGTVYEAKIEKVIANTPYAIKIVNLRKMFGNVKAIDNISLEIYKNEITVLLGHNGAGKSTLFNILGGMCSPTSGNVYTTEYDVFSGNNIRIFRKELGYCLQMNLLMNGLTVEEHLRFFGLLRGMTLQDAKEQSDYWARKFNIYHRRHQYVDELSGGMKRKLCLCIALLGDTLYLLLDEPTSGLDTQSRRDIWDVLLTLRGHRTIIISTHDMEEANILSDRTAIIANGNLICFGTSAFLKQQYGFGYRLKISSPAGDNTLGFIQGYISSARLLSESSAVLSVSLPDDDIKKFPNLFSALDSRYGQSSYSISCTNTEDVFLKVQEDLGVKITVDKDNMPTMLIGTDGQSVRQFGSIWQKSQGLVRKRLLWAFSKWVSFIIYIILMPFGAILAVMSIINVLILSTRVTKLNLDLSLYQNTIVIITKQESDSLAIALESQIIESGSRVQKVYGEQSTVQSLLDVARKSPLEYRSRRIVAFELSDTPNLLYSTLAYHSAPIAYALLSNALLQQANSSARISTYNLPYQLDKKGSQCFLYSIAYEILIIVWTMNYTSVLLMVVSYFLIFPSTERQRGFKHLQLMTGIDPALYWTTLLTADFFIYMISVLVSLITLYITDNERLYTGSIILNAMVIVIVLYGFGAITFSYVCSYVFKTLSYAMNFYVILNIAAVILHFFILPQYLQYVMYIIPIVPLITCIAAILRMVSISTLCTVCNTDIYMHDTCKNIDQVTLSSFGINTELIYLGVDFVLYFLILLLIDYGFVEKIMTHIRLILYGKIKNSIEPLNDEVANEKSKVAQAKEALKNPGSLPPIFLCDNLGKKFSSKVVAVNDVSFAIPNSECFGLLGTNGAGKSSTFEMLTGYLTPTKGNAWVQSYSLISNRRKYLKQIGYCPQQDALLHELSARSHLFLFGRLRGIPASKLPTIVQKWIDAVDLSSICDRPSGGYSGGNKRKLNTAVSLIGDPTVLLLDEPTTGVDAVVKSKIQSILKYCRATSGQTVIVTFHSMEDCEMACDRLTIMVDGYMRCIGTVPLLKNTFGRGYVVIIKLALSSTEDDSELVEKAMRKLFGSSTNLNDKQHGLLTYHTSAKIKLDEVFTNMIKLKSSQTSIEDFTVSNISLEQVFLSVAETNKI